MWEFLQFHGFWLFVVGIPVLGWVLTELSSDWRKVKISEHQAALKQSMVERGMSVEEIERVLAAGSERRCGRKSKDLVASDAGAQN